MIQGNKGKREEGKRAGQGISAEILGWERD
jgi:hypothetical protein